jgi:hypothetical protein
MDIFCLSLSTLVLSSCMTWYGLWMSNTMDTSIESGSYFPSRAHEFALCYQWGSYCLFCLPTCFHIFSHISYIHVKTMFDSPLLRFVLSWFHALFNVTLYFYLFTYSGIQCDFHINGWSFNILFCVVFEGTIVCLFCVPSIPLDCLAFRFTAYDNPVLYRQTFLLIKTHMAFRKVNQYICIDPYNSIFKDNMNI